MDHGEVVIRLSPRRQPEIKRQPHDDDGKRHDDARLSEPDKEETARLQDRAIYFRAAMIALSEPGYLTGHRPLEYETYQNRFFEIFISADIRKHNFC